MEATHTRRWGFFAVITAAALLRLLLLIQYGAVSPLAGNPVVDAAIHHDNAKAIAAGAVVPGEPFSRPPLFAYFTAAIYRACGAEPMAVAAVQAVLGVAGLWLLYRLARFYLDRRPAVLAAALVAFYGPAAFFELKLLPASLSLLLVLVFLNLLADSLKRSSRLWLFPAGLAGGLLVLDRPNMVYLPLLVVIWLGFRRTPGSFKAAAVLAAGLLIGIAPAAVHNAAAGDGSVPLCTGGGLNFYLGNRAGAEVSFTESFEGVADPSQMAATAAKIFEEETGSPHENLGQVERFWIKKGFREIGSDPLSWAGLQIEKVKALLSEFEYGVNYSYAAEKEVVNILHLFIVPFSLLAALGLAGVLAGRGDGRAASMSRAPLMLVLVAVLLSTWTFFTYSRFRLPAVPVLAILGADAATRLVAAVKEKRTGAALRIALPAVIVGAVALLPPGRVAEQQLSGGFALQGKAFTRAGRIEAACASYELAIEADPESIQCCHTLAGIREVLRDYRGAWALYDQALTIAPDDPTALSRAAIFLANSPSQFVSLLPAPFSSPDHAIEMARRAGEIDPELALADVSLGMALWMRGSTGGSEKAFNEAFRKSGRAAWLLQMVAKWYRSQGQARKADALEREIRIKSLSRK